MQCVLASHCHFITYICLWKGSKLKYWWILTQYVQCSRTWAWQQSSMFYKCLYDNYYAMWQSGTVSVKFVWICQVNDCVSGRQGQAGWVGVKWGSPRSGSVSLSVSLSPPHTGRHRRSVFIWTGIHRHQLQIFTRSILLNYKYFSVRKPCRN